MYVYFHKLLCVHVECLLVWVTGMCNVHLREKSNMEDVMDDCWTQKLKNWDVLLMVIFFLLFNRSILWQTRFPIYFKELDLQSSPWVYSPDDDDSVLSFLPTSVYGHQSSVWFYQYFCIYLSCFLIFDRTTLSVTLIRYFLMPWLKQRKRWRRWR